MNTNSNVINPQALTSIFGKIPAFIGSEIIEIQLNSNRSSMFLRLMTSEEVVGKPKKWANWDVIYVDLAFSPIEDINISGWGTKHTIKEFEYNEVGSLLIQCSSNLKIQGRFDWVTVENITPGLIGNP